MTANVFPETANSLTTVDVNELHPLAYATVTFVNDYFSLRRNLNWSGTSVEKLAAIIEATEFIENTYMCQFPGEPTTDTQLLHFPATDVYDIFGRLIPSDEIPLHVQNATAELAIIALTQALTENVLPKASNSEISATERTLGPLKVKTMYSTNIKNKSPSYPKMIAYLNKILVIDNDQVHRN